MQECMQKLGIKGLPARQRLEAKWRETTEHCSWRNALLVVPKWRLVCWLKDDCLNGGPSVLLLPVPLLQGREGCCWRSNLWLKKKFLYYCWPACSKWLRNCNDWWWTRTPAASCSRCREENKAIAGDGEEIGEGHDWDQLLVQRRDWSHHWILVAASTCFGWGGASQWWLPGLKTTLLLKLETAVFWCRTQGKSVYLECESKLLTLLVAHGFGLS